MNYTMGEVCRLLRVPRHRVLYALDRGFVPEPKARVNSVRVFTEEDLFTLRAYFISKNAKRASTEERS